jgi:hypothetical protein
MLIDSQIIGELDADSNSVATEAIVRAVISNYSRSGFIRTTGSPSFNQSFTTKGFTDEPSSAANFDMLWAASTSFTPSMTPSAATNISDRLPTTNGQTRWILAFSDTVNTGARLDNIDMIISDREIELNIDYQRKWDREDWRVLSLKPTRFSRHGLVSLAELMNQEFFKDEDNRLTVKLDIAEKDTTDYVEIVEQWFECHVVFDVVRPFTSESLSGLYRLTTYIESDGSFGPLHFGKKSIERTQVVDETEQEIFDAMYAEIDAEEPLYENIGPLIKWRETVAEIAMGDSEANLIDAYKPEESSDTERSFKWAYLRDWRSEGSEDAEQRFLLRMTLTVDAIEFQFNDVYARGLQSFITGEDKKCFLSPTCDIGQEFTHLNWDFVSASRGQIPFKGFVDESLQIACNAEMDHQGQSPDGGFSAFQEYVSYRFAEYYYVVSINESNELPNVRFGPSGPGLFDVDHKGGSYVDTKTSAFSLFAEQV